jgi:TRAP-type uncharacterized transport system substrate-binding protein
MPTEPEQAQQKPRTSGRIESAALFGGSGLLVLAAFWLASQFVQPAPPNRISIAAGQPGGAYLHYAERYRDELAKHGIELTVLETDGTVDNLQRLLREDGPVDLALVQGGIASAEQRQALSGLGSLFYEPLWVLAPAGAQVRPLNEVAELRIGVGSEGSGTRALVLKLLAANGIEPDDATLVAEPADDSLADLKRGGLDLLFVVAAPDSPVLARALADPAVAVQQLPRAGAYARIDSALSVISLPQGTLSLAEDLPSRDIELLAPTANLVARPDIHPALVDLLIQAAATVHGDGSLLAPPGTFPTPLHSDFPLNPDAERHYKNGPPFLQRYLPFWAATWIDRTKVMLLPLLALLLPLMKVLPPVYAWRVRRRILRWYVQLRRIDLEIQAGPTGPGWAAALHDELEEIEADAACIDVPLGYTDQLYNLRLHIRLLQQKLEGVGSGAPTQ